jgi:serpin B
VKQTASKAILMGLASAILLVSCQKEMQTPAKDNPGNTATTISPPLVPPALTAQEGKTVASSNDFAIRLFSKLRTGQPAQNLFLSPFSISSALTMAYNGANGTTQEAMRQTLGYAHLTDEEINQSFKGLQQLLMSLDKKVVFTSANAIWYDQQFELQAPFVQLNKTYFDATVQGLDFKSADAKNVMNDWVKEKTRAKIDKIVEQIRVDQVMFLVNAVYFKADWRYPFEKGLTRKGTFRKEDGNTSRVNFMTLNNGKYLYYEDAGKKVVDLPYASGQFNMTLIVPQEQNTLSNIALELNSTQLATWLSKADTSWQHLCLPKFNFEYKKDLQPVLTQLGMGEAFSDQADLSRMATGAAGRLKISEVRHNTFLDVNEVGTEAAAATSVGTIAQSYSTPILIDRPFVFLIREKSSNVILFIGQLMNP